MKYLLFLLTSLFFIACNNQSKHDSQHISHIDSGMGHNIDSTASVNEMKKLMDSMMTKMHNLPATKNIDIDYANMMLQHHQAAVDMAKLQLAKGSNVVLKEFSKKVIEDQQKEIAIMGAYISKAKANRSDSITVFKEAMDSIMNTMMMADTKIYNNIDKDFVAQMIPHHQAAVDMAKVYLLHQQSPVLKQLSETIIDTQQREIEWLKDWLAANG